MTHHLTTLLLLFSVSAFGQNSHCFCENDSLQNLTKMMVSCDTTTLSNKSKLYWQFNCDSIWLTLENLDGKKKIIDVMSSELYDIFERGSFHLVKEFNNSILFENRCAATGPCLYTLIDKNDGNKLKEFKQLICIESNYNFDFVVYLSDSTKHLVIDYIDSNKILKVPFKEKLEDIIPEYQFEKMELINNILTLTYTIDFNRDKKLRVDLNSK